MSIVHTAAPARTYKMSHASELRNIVERAAELAARQAELTRRIAADAEFMDVPVIRAQYFDVDCVEYATLGDVFHLGLQESEENGPEWSRVMGHRADRNRCRPWCAHEIGVRTRSRYSRTPNRYWHTFQGRYILVGKPIETELRAPEGVYVFVPEEITRPMLRRQTEAVRELAERDV